MTVKRLGDPHLGRRFTKGVPLDQRGQREQLVREDFSRQLALAEGHRVHVCLGDLFDKPQVPYADVQFAYRQYRAIAAMCPETTFYILQGNHDDSRDLAEVTAWDLFCDNVEGVPNIVTVTDTLVGPDFIMCAWNPTKSAVEMLEGTAEFLQASGYKPTVAYGHWDTDPRSASHNLIPTRELAALGITHAYTGHVHLPSTFMRDGIHVEVVGSMQPYAQGEDGGQSDHIRYATVSLEELQAMAPGALIGTCVRLQLAPGEQWEGELPECRSLDIQRLRPVEADAPADVSMEGFDTAVVAREALDDRDITPEVRQQIDARWTETFGHVEA